MEKKRVKFGEIYWFVNYSDGKVTKLIDGRDPVDDACFNSGNYFYTKEEAEPVAEKIREVLNSSKSGEDCTDLISNENAVDYNWKCKERGDCNYPDTQCLRYFIDGQQSILARFPDSIDIMNQCKKEDKRLSDMNGTFIDKDKYGNLVFSISDDYKSGYSQGAMNMAQWIKGILTNGSSDKS